MREATAEEMRSSFVNCSKGETRRMNLPQEAPPLPWEEMEFLGWRDPRAQEHAYLVTDADEGLVGIALRLSSGGRGGGFFRTMACSLCLTVHPSGGVRLFNAPKRGAAGRKGDSVGLYVCEDLACPLYVRGLRTSPLIQPAETITREERVERLRDNLARFVTGFLVS
ncbi:FBP domain-containing protein [Nocardiopsis alba]|uniref:FBP domain-containing protein n=1 Tax=Nocardiopsis alba TaxID=53437 RepID=UPI0033AABE79